MKSRFRPSPAMVVAVIALFASLTSAGYAVTKIGTRNIKNGAVTAKKLHRSAVINSKIRDHAVTRTKIVDGAVNATKVDSSIVNSGTPGVLVAGANIASNGTVRRFFNRVAGQPPTVSHPSAGTYQITFPGLQGKLVSTSSLSLATLVGDAGEVWLTHSGGNLVVKTTNSAGAAANRAFDFAVVLQSP
jgi:hypothetical protein